MDGEKVVNLEAEPTKSNENGGTRFRESKVVFEGRTYWRNRYGYYRTGDGRRLHRDIWESAHGPLLLDYDVHHVDFNKDNNNLENLQSFPKASHLALHRKKDWERQKANPFHYVCIGCGKEFQSPSPRARYCSYSCYLDSCSDEIIAHKREYLAARKGDEAFQEMLRESRKKWKVAHKDDEQFKLGKRGCDKRYYDTHADEIKARVNRYRIAHSEEIKVKKRAFYLAHKDEILAQCRAYRERKKGASA